MDPLSEVAPAFVQMAHSIVWCTGATTGTDGRPRTRVLRPIWEWDGTALTGWITDLPEIAESQRDHCGAGGVLDVLVGEPRHLHGRL